MVFDRIRDLLSQNGIDLAAPIALADCVIPRPYLLERANIRSDGAAVIFAIPYHTPACENATRNCSRYAVGRDYHLFVRRLSEAILPTLREEFPTFHFAMFADHSPIDERNAAARAGLGLLGKNGLLITERYSSYVFLGEIITDAPPPKDICITGKPPSCENCGACIAACPMTQGKTAECLSAITQKKGLLTAAEQALIATCGSVWGCDLCQAVCPHTKTAIKEGTVTTPLPFFHEAPLPHLTYERIQSMTDAEFSERAYAWRGRQVILRNLTVTEQADETTSQRGQKKTEDCG